MTCSLTTKTEFNIPRKITFQQTALNVEFVSEHAEIKNVAFQFAFKGLELNRGLMTRSLNVTPEKLKIASEMFESHWNIFGHVW